jgi:hypothetical protein
MRILLSAVGVVLVLAAGVRAQGYTIKIKDYPKVGDSVVIRENDQSTTRVKVTAADKKVVEDKTTKETKVEVFTATVLAQPKGEQRPTKYKWAFTKATTTKNKKAQTHSYEGRTVVFERIDGKFEVSVEGEKALAAKDVADLTKRANKKDGDSIQDLVPSKPVAVGESFKIDSKAIAKLPLDDLDAAKSSGEGKLVKVYRKNGQQWGIVTLNLRLALKEADGVKWRPTTYAVTLDAPIDGSAAIGTMKMSARFNYIRQVEQMGRKYMVEVTVDAVGTKEASPVKRRE